MMGRCTARHPICLMPVAARRYALWHKRMLDRHMKELTERRDSAGALTQGSAHDDLGAPPRPYDLEDFVIPDRKDGVHSPVAMKKGVPQSQTSYVRGGDGIEGNRKRKSKERTGVNGDGGRSGTSAFTAVVSCDDDFGLSVDVRLAVGGCSVPWPNFVPRATVLAHRHWRRRRCQGHIAFTVSRTAAWTRTASHSCLRATTTTYLRLRGCRMRLVR